MVSAISDGFSAPNSKDLSGSAGRLNALGLASGADDGDGAAVTDGAYGKARSGAASTATGATSAAASTDKQAGDGSSAAGSAGDTSLPREQHSRCALPIRNAQWRPSSMRQTLWVATSMICHQIANSSSTSSPTPVPTVWCMASQMQLSLELTDSGADGWNGAAWTISESAFGTPMLSGTLAAGSYKVGSRWGVACLFAKPKLTFLTRYLSLVCFVHIAGPGRVLARRNVLALSLRRRGTVRTWVERVRSGRDWITVSRIHSDHQANMRVHGSISYADADSGALVKPQLVAYR